MKRMNVGSLIVRSFTLLAFAAVGLVGASAAAVTPDSNTADALVGSAPGDGRGLSSEDAQLALIAEQKAFPYELPAGVQWPASLPPYLIGEKIRMEENVPLAVLSFYWLCSWENEYLSSADNAKALDMIATFEKLPFYKTQFLDPDGAWRKTVIEPAIRGDSSSILADYQDCEYFDASIAKR